MAEENPIVPSETVKNSRREFVKTAAQVAVTAPAVAMLLSATTKPAMAAPSYAHDHGDTDGQLIPVDDGFSGDDLTITKGQDQDDTL